MTIDAIAIGQAARSMPPAPLRIIGILGPGDIGVLCGPTGVGKSWLALEAAVSVATGKPIGGLVDEVAKGRALYVAASGGRDMWLRRLVAIWRGSSLPQPKETDESLVLATTGSRTPLVLSTTQYPYPDWDAPELHCFAPGALELIERFKGFSFVVLDPLIAFSDLNRHDDVGWDFFARMLTKTARVNGQAILLVCTDPPNPLLSECRAAWSLNPPGPEDPVDRKSSRVLTWLKPEPKVGSSIALNCDPETGMLS